jgi:hypothetical protein
LRLTSAPVCAFTASDPTSDRPTFSTTRDFPTARTRAAAAAKLTGCLIDSKTTPITSVWSSSASQRR